MKNQNNTQKLDLNAKIGQSHEADKFYKAISTALSKVTKDLLTKYPTVKSYTYNDRKVELQLPNGTLRFTLDFHYNGDNSFYLVKPNGGDLDGKVLSVNHQPIN